MRLTTIRKTQSWSGWSRRRIKLVDVFIARLPDFSTVYLAAQKTVASSKAEVVEKDEILLFKIWTLIYIMTIMIVMLPPHPPDTHYRDLLVKPLFAHVWHVHIRANGKGDPQGF